MPRHQDLAEVVFKLVRSSEEVRDVAAQALGVYRLDGVNFDARCVRINNLALPAADGDAANKAYVDAAIAAAIQRMAAELTQVLSDAVATTTHSKEPQ
jgi:hypothetical protein